MATYKKFEKDGYKVQVESAVRDGAGKNIENNYAKQNGYYESLTSGLADNLKTDDGLTDTTPFVFQSSGGSADIMTGNASLKALRGNSVAFNQAIPTNLWGTETRNEFTLTNNGDGSYTINGTASADLYFGASTNFIEGHKYLLKGCPANGGWGSPNKYMIDTGSGIGRDYGEGVIGVATYGGTRYVGFYVGNGQTFSNVKFHPQLIDLTLMFGAGNEPTSVLEFNRLFPKPYYEYNAGTLLSSQTSAYKIVGYNAFDGEIESGGIGAGGNETSSADNFRTKTYTKVIAGQTYTFEYNRDSLSGSQYISEYDENKNFIQTSSGYSNGQQSLTLTDNTHYVRVQVYKSGSGWGTTLPTSPQIAIHLTWSGSKTGYEPYYSQTYELPNVELRSAGSVYDELLPDGTLIRRIGVYKAKDLTWTYNTNYNSFTATLTGKKIYSEATNPITTRAYTPTILIGYDYDYALTNNKAFAYSTLNELIYIKDTAYGTDATAFKNHFGDNDYIYYELATPTTESTTNTFQEIGKIDDYGTQEFLSEQTIQVPQGAEFFYMKNLKDFLRRIGNRADIDYDPNEIVSQSELASAIVHSVEFKTDFSASDSGTISDTDDIALLGKFINQQIFPSVIKIKAKYAASGVITSNYYITDGRLIIKYGSYNNNNYWGLRINYYDNTYTHLT